MTEEEYKEHLEFLEQVEKDVRENRRRNLLFGSILFVVIIIIQFLLGLAGGPIRWGPI